VGSHGRFSNRQWIYPLYVGVEAEAVRTPTVVFVSPPPATKHDPPPTVAATSTTVQNTLKARVVVDSDGIHVFEWLPPRRTTR